MALFSNTIRVYIEDTDAGGIVYHSNYLNYMERVRTDFMRERGYVHVNASQEGYIFVVHSLSIQYKQPAKMDDLVKVDIAINKLARSSVFFKQTVCRDGGLLIDAEVRIACINSQTLKPCSIPEAIHSSLTQYQTEHEVNQTANC